MANMEPYDLAQNNVSTERAGTDFDYLQQLALHVDGGFGDTRCADQYSRNSRQACQLKFIDIRGYVC